MTSQRTTRASSDWTDGGNGTARRFRCGVLRDSPEREVQLMKLRREQVERRLETVRACGRVPRVALYARTMNGLSPDRSLAAAREFAVRRGWLLVRDRTFTDVLDATAAENRYGWQRVKQHVKRGFADGVVVFSRAAISQWLDEYEAELNWFAMHGSFVALVHAENVVSPWDGCPADAGRLIGRPHDDPPPPATSGALPARPSPTALRANAVHHHPIPPPDHEQEPRTMDSALPSPSALPAPAASGTPGPARRWTITTTTGETTTGHLPAWADTDPSEHGVPPQELAVRLADINHTTEFPGQTLRAYSPGNPTNQPTPLEILHSSIDCTPYATGPEPTVPVVNIRLAEEYWLTDYGPEDLTRFADGLRAVADRLDHVVIPTLNAARTDWTTHHPHTTGGRP